MVAIITLLVTVTIALLVTRIAAVALTLTGLSQEVARFQARSAFTGCGFTTNESESVVNHPVRRKILTVLMFCGNLGIAAVIASAIASFSDQPTETGFDSTIEAGKRIALLALGLMLMWILFTSRWFDQKISLWIEWALLKWTKLDVRDYVSLLHLSSGYVVLELQVNPGDWIADKTLAECRLSDEGVLLLGVHRAGGQYVGSPNGRTLVREGDSLSLYGPIERLEELDLRKKGYQGDRAHRIAVRAQLEISSEEDKPGGEVTRETAGNGPDGNKGRPGQAGSVSKSEPTDQPDGPGNQ